MDKKISEKSEKEKGHLVSQDIIRALDAIHLEIVAGDTPAALARLIQLRGRLSRD